MNAFFFSTQKYILIQKTMAGETALGASGLGVASLALLLAIAAIILSALEVFSSDTMFSASSLKVSDKLKTFESFQNKLDYIGEANIFAPHTTTFDVIAFIASPTAEIQGYTLLANDLILVDSGTSSASSGMYVFTAAGTALTSYTTFFDAVTIAPGSKLWVKSGSYSGQGVELQLDFSTSKLNNNRLGQLTFNGNVRFKTPSQSIVGLGALVSEAIASTPLIAASGITINGKEVVDIDLTSADITPTSLTTHVASTKAVYDYVAGATGGAAVGGTNGTTIGTAGVVPAPPVESLNRSFVGAGSYTVDIPDWAASPKKYFEGDRVVYLNTIYKWSGTLGVIAGTSGATFDKSNWILLVNGEVDQNFQDSVDFAYTTTTAVTAGKLNTAAANIDGVAIDATIIGKTLLVTNNGASSTIVGVYTVTAFNGTVDITVERVAKFASGTNIYIKTGTAFLVRSGTTYGGQIFYTDGTAPASIGGNDWTLTLSSPAPYTGATLSVAGVSGIVTSAPIGSLNHFYRGDGTWSTPITEWVLGAHKQNDIVKNGNNIYYRSLAADFTDSQFAESDWDRLAFDPQKGHQTAVHFATTKNIASIATYAGSSIDGINIANGNTILVKNQTDATQNGIYSVTTLGSKWDRTSGFDSSTNQKYRDGTKFYIMKGKTNFGRTYTSHVTSTPSSPGSSDWLFVLASERPYANALPIKYASTINIPTYSSSGGIDSFTASGSIDGQTLQLNERVMIKDQTTTSENGIYTLDPEGTANKIVRVPEFNGTNYSTTIGTQFLVTSGSTNGGKLFYLSSGNATWGIGGTPGTWGSDLISFIEYSGTAFAGYVDNNVVQITNTQGAVPKPIKGSQFQTLLGSGGWGAPISDLVFTKYYYAGDVVFNDGKTYQRKPTFDTIQTTAFDDAEKARWNEIGGKTNLGQGPAMAYAILDQKFVVGNTLTGLSGTLDGVNISATGGANTITANDYILVMGQSLPQTNGVYYFSSIPAGSGGTDGILSRVPEFQLTVHGVREGMHFYIRNGTINGGKTFEFITKTASFTSIDSGSGSAWTFQELNAATMVGPTVSTSGTSGVVPTPAIGDQNAVLIANDGTGTVGGWSKTMATRFVSESAAFSSEYGIKYGVTSASAFATTLPFISLATSGTHGSVVEYIDVAGKFADNNFTVKTSSHGLSNGGSQSGTFNAIAGNTYDITNNLTMTLPPTPSDKDVVEISCATGFSVIVTSVTKFSNNGIVKSEDGRTFVLNGNASNTAYATMIYDATNLWWHYIDGRQQIYTENGVLQTSVTLSANNTHKRFLAVSIGRWIIEGGSSGSTYIINSSTLATVGTTYILNASGGAFNLMLPSQDDSVTGAFVELYVHSDNGTALSTTVKPSVLADTLDGVSLTNSAFKMLNIPNSHYRVIFDGTGWIMHRLDDITDPMFADAIGHAPFGFIKAPVTQSTVSGPHGEVGYKIDAQSVTSHQGVAYTMSRLQTGGLYHVSLLVGKEASLTARAVVGIRCSNIASTGLTLRSEVILNLFANTAPLVNGGFSDKIFNPTSSVINTNFFLIEFDLIVPPGFTTNAGFSNVDFSIFPAKIETGSVSENVTLTNSMTVYGLSIDRNPVHFVHDAGLGLSNYNVAISTGLDTLAVGVDDTLTLLDVSNNTISFALPSSYGKPVGTVVRASHYKGVASTNNITIKTHTSSMSLAAITGPSPAYNGSINTSYSIDTSAGAINIILPVITADDVLVRVYDIGNNLASIALDITPDATASINQAANGLKTTLATNGTTVVLRSNLDQLNWEMFTVDEIIQQESTSDTNFKIISKNNQTMTFTVVSDGVWLMSEPPVSNALVNSVTIISDNTDLAADTRYVFNATTSGKILSLPTTATVGTIIEIADATTAYTVDNYMSIGLKTATQFLNGVVNGAVKLDVKNGQWVAKKIASDGGGGAGEKWIVEQGTSSPSYRIITTNESNVQLGREYRIAATSAFVLTLPAALGSGKTIKFVETIGSGIGVTVTPKAGEYLNGVVLSATGGTRVMSAGYASWTLTDVSTGKWVMDKDYISGDKLKRATYYLGATSSNAIICPLNLSVGGSDTSYFTNTAGVITVPVGTYRVVPFASVSSLPQGYDLYDVTNGSSLANYDSAGNGTNSPRVPYYMTNITPRQIAIRTYDGQTTNTNAQWNNTPSTKITEYTCHLTIEQVQTNSVYSPGSLVPTTLDYLQLGLSGNFTGVGTNPVNTWSVGVTSNGALTLITSGTGPDSISGCVDGKLYSISYSIRINSGASEYRVRAGATDLTESTIFPININNVTGDGAVSSLTFIYKATTNDILQVYPVSGSGCLAGATHFTIRELPTATVVRAEDAAVKEWTPYTLVVGSDGTPPTFGVGTVNLDQAYYKTIGKTLSIRYCFKQQNTQVSPGSGTYIFPIPPGYTIDTAVNPGILSGLQGCVVGSAHFRVLSAGPDASGVCKVYDTTNLRLSTSETFSATSTFNYNAHANLLISFCADVAIL
jgi:hypothetical protein